MRHEKRKLDKKTEKTLTGFTQIWPGSQGRDERGNFWLSSWIFHLNMKFKFSNLYLLIKIDNIS